MNRSGFFAALCAPLLAAFGKRKEARPVAGTAVRDGFGAGVQVTSWSACGTAYDDGGWMFTEMTTDAVGGKVWVRGQFMGEAVRLGPFDSQSAAIDGWGYWLAGRMGVSRGGWRRTVISA